MLKTAKVKRACGRHEVLYYIARLKRGQLMAELFMLEVVMRLVQHCSLDQRLNLAQGAILHQRPACFHASQTHRSAAGAG